MESNNHPVAIVSGSEPVRRAPVRVRLKRVVGYAPKPYPPNGETTDWWVRLKAALGTASSDFVNASLFQLQTAAQLPDTGVSEMAMNAAIAFIEGVKPQNEMECALAMQMACTHAAAMNVLGRLNSPGGGGRRDAALAGAVSRLLRSYAVQIEALRRLRNGGSQIVRVEHVQVNAGANAIFGNIRK